MRTAPRELRAPQRTRALERALLVIGVAALGFNLRAAITSLPPVFPELAGRLQLSALEISVLAATPVICFGVVSGIAPSLSRRLGEERVLLAALILLTAGLILRGAAPGTLLFPGTVLAAAAIAVMNVLLSSLIKRRWPQRAGFLVGLYIMTLSAGAIAGSLLSVPVYQASGRSIPLALGWLAIPAAIGVILGPPRAGGGAAPGPAPAAIPATVAGARPGAGRSPLWRHALAWQVTLFMGMQSLLYYGSVSWLPTIFRDRGVSASAAGGLLGV